MKNYLMILSLSILCSNLFGQVDLYKFMEYWFLLEKGKSDSVLILINQEMAKTKNVYLYFLKGRAEYELKQYQNALTDLSISQHYVDTTTDFMSFMSKSIKAISLMYTGNCYLKTGQKDSAVYYLKKSIDIEAADEWITVSASQTLKELGDNYGYDKINKLKLINEKVPDFELSDIYGKAYSLNKLLLQTPLVIHFGPTWCGGCQSDAKGYDAFAKSYKDKNILFSHVFIGETPVSALDFLKHYRSNMFALIDYDYKIANKYKVQFYSTTFFINKDGVNLFNKHDIFYNYKEDKLKKLIDTLPIRSKDNNQNAVYTVNSCYVPSHKKDTTIYESSPKAVIDKDKNIWVVFYSDRNGNNDIYLRCYKGEKVINEFQVTKTSSDDYSPDIAITPDQTIWLSWVSNLDGNYNIYACSIKNRTFSEPARITKAFDDAFHPSIISDNINNVHIAYYKWDTLWHFSRDRDIYYKFYNGKNWSSEIRVSPTIPKEDDATDPSIVCDNNQNVYIAYSYDFHPNLSKPDVQAIWPTIFFQKMKDTTIQGGVNGHTLIGTKVLVYRDVIDITPSLACDANNNIWCAWDALTNETRYIFCKKTTDNSEIVISDKSVIAINPSIKIAPNNVPYIVWTQNKVNKWEIFGSKFENGLWTMPTKLIDEKYNCREPVLVMNKNNKYIVFTELRNDGSKIKLREIKDY